MSDLTLYGLPQSNFVWATRIAIAQKGVPHQLVESFPGTPDVAAIHPFGRVPVMRHGDVTLAESRAIVLYVDRAFDGPALHAADLPQAARDEMWTSIAITAIDAVLIRQYTFAYIFPKTADGSPDRAVIDAAWPRIEQTMAALDRAVADGDILGEHFRLPDAWIIPMLHLMSVLPDWSRMAEHGPRLPDALARAMARPAVQATVPPPLPAKAA